MVYHMWDILNVKATNRMQICKTEISLILYNLKETVIDK
jgi:hypothetical protein